MNGRMCGYTLAATFAGFVILSMPARAQSAFSEQIARLMQAQKNAPPRPVEPANVFAPAGSPADARNALTKRIALYEVAKDFAAAEAELTDALAREPRDASLRAERGYFYLRQNRYGDALDDFLAGSRMEPGNARFRYAAGRVQAARGYYSAAIVFYDEAIRLNPRDAGSFLARAEARIHLDMPFQAVADYDRAIAIGLARAGDRYFAYLGRGYLALVRGDHVAAIDDFDRALEVDPESVNALLWRGYARERAGRNDLALDDYERAVTVDPKDRVARVSLQRLRSN